MFKTKNHLPPLRDIDKKDPMLKTRSYLPFLSPNHLLPLLLPLLFHAHYPKCAFPAKFAALLRDCL